MPKTKSKRPPHPRTHVFGDAALKLILEMVAAAPKSKGGDAIDQAQELIFDAWECPQKHARIALARKALELSADCADAYVLLGRDASKTPEEAIAYYRDGVKAGERALGKQAFKNDVGYFWGYIETRPYMRARYCLALSLWKSGARDEAVSHYQDMLRMNPNDNQGIRYSLLTALILLGKDKEATALHKKYKEDSSADWAWSKALLSFRATGDSVKSRVALAKATICNKHVVAYLTGRKPLPKTRSDYISPGAANEASTYVENALEAWKNSPNSTTWVAHTLALLQTR